MLLRTTFSGLLAALFVTAIAAAPALADQSDTGFSFRLPTLGVLGGDKQQHAQVAQQLDGGVGMTAVEDQIRRMNGKIEELNFQILQMQEQIRKQQEDNEFRFQQLEGGGQDPQKKSDAGDTVTRSVAEAPASPNDEIGTVIAGAGDGVLLGAPPTTFGTITVDKDGNVINAGQTAQAIPKAATPQASGDADTVVAALPRTDDPDELYRNSYQFILSGDYATAEQGFRDHIERFPGSGSAADAHYWLGEALLGQQKYRDAAEVFLAASKDYPKARKAPDMLLKLGVSLAGLNQHDVACATFGEIDKRYPDISSAMKARIEQERALSSC